MAHNLNRFIEAQDVCYEVILTELASGQKNNHWIWYIFPQLKGLGQSWNSQFYGIDGIEEAKEYLNNDVLSSRLRECCRMLLEHKDRQIEKIMGHSIDAMKLKSSMTLFDQIDPGDVFSEVLDAFYGGDRDELTLQKISDTYEL